MITEALHLFVSSCYCRDPKFVHYASGELHMGSPNLQLPRLAETERIELSAISYSILSPSPIQHQILRLLKTATPHNR